MSNEGIAARESMVEFDVVIVGDGGRSGPGAAIRLKGNSLNGDLTVVVVEKGFVRPLYFGLPPM